MIQITITKIYKKKKEKTLRRIATSKTSMKKTNMKKRTKSKTQKNKPMLANKKIWTGRITKAINLA